MPAKGVPKFVTSENCEVQSPDKQRRQTTAGFTPNRVRNALVPTLGSAPESAEGVDDASLLAQLVEAAAVEAATGWGDMEEVLVQLV
jgi:hypothetical protein